MHHPTLGGDSVEQTLASMSSAEQETIKERCLERDERSLFGVRCVVCMLASRECDGGARASERDFGVMEEK